MNNNVIVKHLEEFQVQIKIQHINEFSLIKEKLNLCIANGLYSYLYSKLKYNDIFIYILNNEIFLFEEETNNFLTFKELEQIIDNQSNLVLRGNNTIIEQYGIFDRYIFLNEVKRLTINTTLKIINIDDRILRFKNLKVFEEIKSFIENYKIISTENLIEDLDEHYI